MFTKDQSLPLMDPQSAQANGTKWGYYKCLYGDIMPIMYLTVKKSKNLQNKACLPSLRCLLMRPGVNSIKKYKCTLQVGPLFL